MHPSPVGAASTAQTSSVKGGNGASRRFRANLGAGPPKMGGGLARSERRRRPRAWVALRRAALPPPNHPGARCPGCRNPMQEARWSPPLNRCPGTCDAYRQAATASGLTVKRIYRAGRKPHVEPCAESAAPMRQESSQGVRSNSRTGLTSRSYRRSIHLSISTHLYP